MDPVVLIFGGLALFVIFKLVSVLGTRTGHEQNRPDIDGLQRARAEDNNHAAAAADDEMENADQNASAAPVSPAAAPLSEADPNFDERQFLEGAKAAYEMIVEAFAAGDLKSIRRYLESSVYDAFKGAVAAREEAGSRFDLKFVGTEDAAVASAKVEGGSMYAVVDFDSNQVRVTYDRDGNVIDGDPNRVDLVRDRWTFSRGLRSSDPNWTLVATGARA